jgi:hypothetical protein
VARPAARDAPTRRIADEVLILRCVDCANEEPY